MLGRGFIGPIGDDLPSLVPLLVALVVFFSTFTYTFGIFEEKNRDFASDLETTKIAKGLLSNGYITGLENFRELCATITASRVNYVAGLTDSYSVAGGPGLELASLDFFGAGDEEMVCSNVGEWFDLEDELRGKALLARVYPIVYQHEKIVKPMHLVVVSWRD